jgi:hypothetical protein
MSEKIESTETTVEKEAKEIELIYSDTEDSYDDYYIAKKLVQLKQSADSRKIDFSLKFSTVKKLLNSKACYYTGKSFTKKGPHSRSIDRVDSSKGYVDGNVVACTSEINMKKTNLTIDEILTISKKVEKHLNRKKK